MYLKAMPAGSAGYITPSYGMEEVLKPTEPIQEKEENEEEEEDTLNPKQE